MYGLLGSQSFFWGQVFPPSLCCSHMAWPTQTPQAMRSAKTTLNQEPEFSADAGPWALCISGLFGLV